MSDFEAAIRKAQGISPEAEPADLTEEDCNVLMRQGYHPGDYITKDMLDRAYRADRWERGSDEEGCKE